MNGIVRQRGRIVRVRRLQHGLAAGAAAAAAGQVQLLEINSARLAHMRGELGAAAGATTGAALARTGELAMRLDAARLGLGRSIDTARAVAATRDGERIAARRDQEGAEKLHQAAETAAARLAERQAQRTGRIRARFTISEGGES